MKSFIKYLTIITTTIILVIGVPLYSFAYTVQTFEPVGSTLSHNTADANGVVSTVTSTATKIYASDVPYSQSWVLCDGTYNDTRQYPYYLASTIRVPSSISMDTEGTLLCNYDLDNLNGFNSITFNCCVLAPRDDYEFYNSFYLTINDQPSDIPFTTTYEYGDSYEHAVFGVYVRWRSVRLNFYFDEVYNFDTANLKIYVNTYLPYVLGNTITYAFGMNDLEAKVVTQEEYVADISQNVVALGNKIDVTNTQLGVIGSKADEISNQVSEAVDILKQDLTQEQQQKVDDVMDSMQTRQEVEEEVIDKVDDLFTSLDNLDYDPFDDAYKDAYQNELDSLFLSPFESFWTSFWLDPLVVAFILIAIAFAYAGFLLFGVR